MGRRSAAGILSMALAAATGCGPAARQQPRFINPAGLVQPNGYSHIAVSPDGRTAYIAGQIALDSAGQLVGPGDFAAQAQQVYDNLGRALAAVGASWSDVMKTTTFITDVRNAAALRAIRGRYLDAGRPPANSLIPVPTLARAELLLEVEAIVALR